MSKPLFILNGEYGQRKYGLFILNTMCNIYAVEMGFSSNSREEQSCFIIVKIFGGTANLRRQTQLQLQMNFINKHTLPIVFTHDVPQCVCKEAFSNFLKLHVFFRNHTGHGF